MHVLFHVWSLDFPQLVLDADQGLLELSLMLPLSHPAVRLGALSQGDRGQLGVAGGRWRVLCKDSKIMSICKSPEVFHNYG